MPFFSIVIPVYNKEKFISNTLNSIFNQSFQDFEIIIVNDGSTDDSEEIISSFNDCRIKYYYQENHGVSAARNLGIRKASSNYIAFLDADDFWYPNLLEEFNSLINKQTKYKVYSAAIEIQTQYKTIPANYSVSNLIDNHIYLEDYFKGSLLFSVIFTSCAVFDKSIFNEIGCFDESIKSGEDTDLWIRIGLVHKIVFLNKILCTYIYDENSLSRDKRYNVTKLNYEKFKQDEANNLSLKKFLDLNRYSDAINNKLLGNRQNYHLLKNQIHLNNLSLKKKIILNTPKFFLNLLLAIQPFLIRLGLRKTLYK